MRHSLMIIATSVGILALLAFGPTHVQAQNKGNAGLILELPASTRALGLGNAYMLSGNESDALFYNPALLGQSTGSSFIVGRYSTSATMMVASSSIGGFAFGIQSISYAAGSRDILMNPVGIAEITSDNPVAVGELVGSIGYGREILGFDVGLGAKWIHQRVGSGRAATVAADLGVIREIGFMNLGVALQNIGPDMTVGTVDLPLPVRLGFAASTDVEQLGPLDVALSTALYRLHDGGIMAGGGAEVSIWPIVGRTFTARIGALHQPHTGKLYFTVGGAITLDNVTGSYAFQDVSTSGSGHFANLRWR